MAPISGIYVFVGFDVPSVSIWGSFDPTRHQETLVQIQSIADRNADTFGGDANLPLADHDIGLLRFPDLSGALAAAAALQVDLSDANLPGRVAVTINEGLRESIASHVIDRLRSMVELAHPGQVVADGLSYSLSQSIEYPSESMTDLGMHYVGARSISERLYQLHHPRLASTFPLEHGQHSPRLFTSWWPHRIYRPPRGHCGDPRSIHAVAAGHARGDGRDWQNACRDPGRA